MRFIPVIFLLALTGCTTAPEPLIPTDIFMCEQGRQFVAHFAPDGDKAVVYLNDDTSTLERIPGTAPPQYTDGALTLHMTGPATAYLSHDDVPLFTACSILAD